ncbi:LEA type 2 family protein [Arcanobacterium haemolyticum]|nr:LEA type 2 family protein [Arcanobacterium haemolyticum]
MGAGVAAGFLAVASLCSTTIAAPTVVAAPDSARVVLRPVSDPPGDSPRRSVASEDAAPVEQATLVASTEPAAEITSVGNALLGPDEDLSVTVSVSNPSSEPVTVTRVDLSGQDSTAATRTRLLSFLDGANVVLRRLGGTDSSFVVNPGESVSATVTVPRADLRWSSGAAAWGPRGVEATVTLEGGVTLSDRSVVVLAPNYELARTPTGVVVPVTSQVSELSNAANLEDVDDPEVSPSASASASPSASVSPGASPSVSSSPSTGAQVSSSASRLPSLVSPGVTALVQPDAIVEATKDGSASSLSALSSGENSSVIATAMYDADAAALVHAGKRSELTSSYATGATSIASTGMSVSTTVAVAAPGIDQETLAGLAEAGVQGVVVSGDDTRPTGYRYATASARTTLQYGDGSSMPALATDTTMSGALAGVLVGDGEVAASSTSATSLSPLDSRQLVLGLSAVTYKERPNDQRPVVLAVDRPGILHYGKVDPAQAGDDTALGASNLSATISALMSAPWVAPRTVESMLADEASDSERTALPVESVASGEASKSEMASLSSSLGTITKIANLSADPALVVQPVTEVSAILSGVAWRSATATRSDKIDEFAAVASDFASSVVVSPSSTINVISRETSLPVHVENSLGIDIGVVVSLTSRDQRLVSSSEVAVTIPAHGSAKVSIPVEATGSGNISVVINVLSPSGERVGASQALAVRVRADWENTGTLVVGVGLGLVLLVGVVRSLRHGRRSKDAFPDSSIDVEDPSDATPGESPDSAAATQGPQTSDIAEAPSNSAGTSSLWQGERLGR